MFFFTFFPLFLHFWLFCFTKKWGGPEKVISISHHQMRNNIWERRKMVKLLTEVKHLDFPQFTEKRFHMRKGPSWEGWGRKQPVRGLQQQLALPWSWRPGRIGTGNTQHPIPKYGAEMYMAPFANCHQTLVLVIRDHPPLHTSKVNWGKQVLEITVSFGGSFGFTLQPAAEKGGAGQAC